MHDGAEIGAKVNKHGAKSLETQATSDNVHYVYRVPVWRGLPYRLRQPDPSHLSPATSNAPQASLTPTSRHSGR